MPTYTKQNSRVPDLSIRAEFSGNGGAAVTAKCAAMVESFLVNDADAADWVKYPDKFVAFDLLDPLLATKTVTAAGKTVTYLQFAALARQLALDRANA